MTLVVGARPESTTGSGGGRATIRIAFVNNMPDAAFDATEHQFLEVIGAAANGLRVEVSLYSLPGISRSDALRDRLDASYGGLHDLWDARPDALVVTGSEPRAADLASEPYFDDLARLISWAETATVSTILSCLAAHAGLYVFDGITRSALPKKCSGVIDNDVVTAHELTEGMVEPVLVPHSRLNDVPRATIEARGYTTLLGSPPASWTLAAKTRGRCLFVLNQGHPEYGTETLLREYRRDVRRYLAGESAIYPEIPEGYLRAADVERLEALRRAGPERAAGELSFPYREIAAGLVNTWRLPARRLYANWLQHVARQAPVVSAQSSRAS